jgi:hypothetical protein
MRPHVQLATHWGIDAVLIAVLIAIYEHTAFRFLMIAMIVPYGVYEARWLKRVYRVAPTPKQFVAAKPYWKALAVWYGLFLCLLGFIMLTVGQDFSRHLVYHSEQLALFLVALLIPLAVFLVAHQAAVFRALRAGEV